MESGRLAFFQKLNLGQNLLIVGPPETGKIAILKSLPLYQNALYIDLEDQFLVKELLMRPDLLDQIIQETEPGDWIAINHIERISKYFPKILNFIENKKIFIAATCTSLKEISLELQNRSYIYYTTNNSFEQTENINSLSEILSFGSLPKIYTLEKNIDKIRYLKTYLQDFLAAEIIAKSYIRNLVPFHLFLPLAAKTVGKKLNFTALAQELDVDYKTVQYYYELLIQFRLGFYLPAYQTFVRKGQSKSAQFYFFDTGIYRAVENSLDQIPDFNNTEYNLLFKSWCINEIIKISSIRNLNYKFSQLETKDKVRIDLVLEKPNGEVNLIVFIAAATVLPRHVKHLKSLGKSIPKAKLYCVHNLEKETGPFEINYKNFFNSLR